MKKDETIAVRIPGELRDALERERQARSKRAGAERSAWHRFCCLNSRDPADVAVARKISARIEVLGKEIKPS